VRLLRGCQDLVYNICWQVLHHKEDAEDAAQEALAKVARDADRIRQPERFRSWLHGVALHTALDALRKRKRRAAHEKESPAPAGGGGLSDEEREALHRSLAKVDDNLRAPIIEYYFQHRTLEDIAADTGSTAAVVWKRVERGKERLATLMKGAGLGAVLPGVAPFLESIQLKAAPADLAVKAAAAAGAGTLLLIPLAAGIPLLAGAIILVVAVTARSTPEPVPPPQKTPVAVAPTPAPEQEEPAPVAQEEPAEEPQPKSVEHLPDNPKAKRDRWPYEYPPASWPAAQRDAWKTLQQGVTMDFQNVPLTEVLDYLRKTTGLKFRVAPGLGDISGELVSCKLRNMQTGSALKLLLTPRGYGYRILPDGTVLIDEKDNIASDPVAEDLRLARREMRMASMKGKGPWDGIPYVGLSPQGLQELNDKLSANVSIDMPSATYYDLWNEIYRLTKIRIYSREGGLLPQEARAFRFEGSLEGLLDEVCAVAGVGYCVSERGVVLSSREKAAGERAAMEEEAAQYEEVGRKLEQPFAGCAAATLSEFGRRIEAALGMPVVLSQKVWEAAGRYAFPAGKTIRETLDSFAAATGFQWVVYNGKVFLLHPNAWEDLH
jgi:RNA polymerase sigma factor (sigma-70 family)